MRSGVPLQHRRRERLISRLYYMQRTWIRIPKTHFSFTARYSMLKGSLSKVTLSACNRSANTFFHTFSLSHARSSTGHCDVLGLCRTLAATVFAYIPETSVDYVYHQAPSLLYCGCFACVTLGLQATQSSVSTIALLPRPSSTSGVLHSPPSRGRKATGGRASEETPKESQSRR